MMFQWKPDMIRFMRDASEYGDYYRALTQIAAPYLNRDSHVCDAGCGLGYLSLELARVAGRVTAVDTNSHALEVLRHNCAQRGVDNIDVVCDDVFSLPPQRKFSAMVFCYFGDVDAILSCAAGRCSGPLLIFKRNYAMHRFSVGRFQKESDGFEEACRKLDQKQIRYRAFAFEHEFGQPFRNLEDARAFYELYSLDADKKAITDLLLMDRLVPTHRQDFPLYMPHRKKSGCIVIHPQGEPAE